MRQKLLELDLRLTASLRIAERPGFLRSFAVVLAHSGDSWFWGLGLILVLLFGAPGWKWRAMILLLGTLFTAVVVFLVKLIVRRQRPEGQWGSIYRSTDPHSFPSGHAARALMLAVTAAGLGPVTFAMVLALWAPLVSLARVAMGVHYLSDVLAGALLGGAIGLFLLLVVGAL
jgi:membrane-associated phospholipid phosphatase